MHHPCSWTYNNQGLLHQPTCHTHRPAVLVSFRAAQVRVRGIKVQAAKPGNGSPSAEDRTSQLQDPAMATGADGKSGHAGQPERPKAGSASEVLHSAVPPKSVKPIRGDARMTAQHQGLLFAIPPANLTTPLTEVLHCPTMRDILGPPRPTPLDSTLSGIWEGRYVSDADRVALNVMQFGSPNSTGAQATRVPAPGPAPGATASTVAAATAAGPDQRPAALMSGAYGGDGANFMSLDSFIAAAQNSQDLQQLEQQYGVCVPLPPFAMRAGPRDEIYFDPKAVTAAVVSTGNICPGMNDVTQAVVKRLQDYGVDEENVLGIRYGLRGFSAKDAKPVVLTRDKIDGIHLTGGTILGTGYEHRIRHHRHHQPKPHGPSSSSSSSSSLSSEEEIEDVSSSNSSSKNHSSGRGQHQYSGDTTGSSQYEAILDKLDFWRINMLFVIGGQGGNQLAAQLADGCQRRHIPCCIVGVPKSIDNDVMLVDRTFGFDTVVQEVVQRPLQAAKVEAASARKGIGLVKVFGRRAGFIAVQASLASGVVDVCLIPEDSFELDGPAGLLQYIQQLLERQGHVVICVAEGAGQDLLYPGGETIPVDEHGNPVLRDVGALLKKSIKAAIPDADIKYIDPTYMVQAVPCNSQDHILCRVLAMHAVDAAFAGYTGVMVGQVNGHFALLPSDVITQSARQVDLRGRSWLRLRAAIGQPRFKNTPTQQPVRMAAVATASQQGINSPKSSDQ